MSSVIGGVPQVGSKHSDPTGSHSRLHENHRYNRCEDVIGQFNGSIETVGDSGWIKITLVAETTYSFNLASSSSNGDSDFNPMLAIYSDDGTLLASNDDVGRGAIVNPLIGNDTFETASYLNFTAT